MAEELAPASGRLPELGGNFVFDAEDLIDRAVGHAAISELDGLLASEKCRIHGREVSNGVSHADISSSTLHAEECKTVHL